MYDSCGERIRAAGAEGVRAAVNQEFADWSATGVSGDEVAFIPPVSGGVHGVGVLFELTPDPLGRAASRGGRLTQRRPVRSALHRVGA